MTCPRHHFVVTIYDNGGSYSSDVGPLESPNIWDCTTDATLKEAISAAAMTIQASIEESSFNERATRLDAIEVIRNTRASAPHAPTPAEIEAAWKGWNANGASGFRLHEEFEDDMRAALIAYEAEKGRRG